MNEKEIFEKISEIVIDVIEDDIELEDTTDLVDDELMDSLELINYLTQIEEEFDINISLDDLMEKKLGIIGKIVKFISENK